MRASSEGIALLLSVTLLFSVFGYALWESRPLVEMWTVTVFYSETYGETIHVGSIGDSFKVFLGHYNFTAGKTYRITYLKGLGCIYPKILAVEEVPS